MMRYFCILYLCLFLGISVSARAENWVRKKADGYYPAWVEELKKGMILSDPVFSSPVGFVEQKQKPLKWGKLEDLMGKTFGTVIDYGNTAEFNALVQRRILKVEEARDDETNIKKVMGGRLDGAFVDLVNGQYLIARLGPQAMLRIQINEKIIAHKSLHIVFNSAYKDKADLFNKLLKKANIQKKIDQFLRENPPAPQSRPPLVGSK